MGSEGFDLRDMQHPRLRPHTLRYSMKILRNAFLLGLLALPISASAIIVTVDWVVVSWDVAGPIGWTNPEKLAEVSGNTLAGEYPADVSANCADVEWAQAGVHAVTWAGAQGIGAWTVDIGGRGYNTGVAKADDCSIFIDFTGGGVTYDLPVSFE